MGRATARLGAVEGWVVTHDGETLKSGLKNDFDAVNWLHKRVGYSVDHAVRHEGYDIVLVRDGKVEHSYRREALKREQGGSSMGARRPAGSEGTAYIDKQGGRWVVRWWSEDERRYYQVKTASTLEEAKRWAEREGYKVVVAEPHNLGGADPRSWTPAPAGGPRPVKGARDVDTIPLYPSFVDAYLEAALWASPVGDNEQPLDNQGYTIQDFAQKAVDEAVKDSNDFIRANERLLTSVGTMEQHGHDFWLTRNHHGAGFWDRGYGNVGKLLTKSAHTYGELFAYAGDDKKIYFEGG